MIRFLLILIIAIPALGADTLTIPDAIEKAIENNYSIKIIRHQAAIAENNVSYGNAGMLPRVDARAGANYSQNDIKIELMMDQNIDSKGSPSKTYNAGVELGWTIFDGFAMFANYDKYVMLHDKSQIELQIMIENTVKNLIVAYYDGLRLQETLELLEENIRLTQQRIDRIEGQIEYGRSVSLEKMRAETDLSADSSNYLQTKLALDNVKRSINLIMNSDAGIDFRFDEKLDVNQLTEYAELEAQTIENNSSINKALKDKEISQIDIKRIRSTFFPRLQLNGAYNFSRTESDAGFMLLNQSKGFNVGINLSYNLFSGNQNSIAYQNAQIASEISEISLEQLKTQILTNLGNAYENYKMRLKILEMEERNLAASEQSFTRTNELYKLGQATSLELRQAQLALLQMKNRIITARIQAKIAEAEILLLSGQILKD